MKRALLVLGAFLLLVSPAAAKGPLSVELCGLSGCASAFAYPSPHAAPLDGLVDWSRLDLAPLPAPGPYYEIRRKADWIQDAEPWFYVQGAGAIQIGRSWLRLDKETAARLRAVARRVEPWSWTGFSDVRLRGRRAAEPLLYEALLGHLPRAESPAPGSAHFPLLARTRMKRPEHQLSPWTDGRTELDWYPTQRVLYRDGEWLRVPEWLQRRMRIDAGLVARSPEPETAVPWGLVAGSVAGCALAVAFALALARRWSAGQAGAGSSSRVPDGSRL